MILASKSPRRKEILENFGLCFRVEEPDIEETSSQKNIEDQIIEIALKKAKNIGNKFPDEYVVSADTVVVIGNEVLGKPIDKQDAAKMLEKLSGKVHKVITAYSLYCKNRDLTISNAVVTEVKFRVLSQDTIEWYIETGEAFDKAGAYGIQGKGSVLVEEIKGDFFSVMGFPLSDFIASLEKNGILLNDLNKIL